MQYWTGVHMNKLPLARFAVALTAMLYLTVSQADAEKASPRLKYRSKGSVCACETGMGEKEISSAMKRAGLDRLQPSTAEAGSEDAKVDGQHSRREADGNEK
jgi:hypothetical protein